MTLETFLEKLEQTPRDWELLPSGAIRRFPVGQAGQCPISSLRSACSVLFDEVASALGMNWYLAEEIAETADRPRGTELRAKLLKACGLESA